MTDNIIKRGNSLDDMLLIDKNNNGIIDDDYIYQLHEKLKLMKEQRKLSEKENRSLNGRVNCLKNEYEKTLKKIEATKLKTKNRILSIEKKENKNKERQKMLQQKEKEINNLKMKNYYQKYNLENEIINKREEKLKNNKKKNRLLKEQQKMNMEIIKSLDLEDINNKKNNVNFIKSQHYLNEERKKAIELSKKNDIKIDLENKLNLELELKKENEKKIKELLNIENEILIRIQNTTTMHRQLIEEFEKLFSQPEYIEE